MFCIELLRDPGRGDLRAVRRLLAQLTDRRLNRRAFQQKGAYIYAMRDRARKGRPIIGMASVYFIQKLAGTQCFVEDVVVDGAYRGKGLGKILMGHLIVVAYQKKAKCVDLTSKPERESANNLYLSLGFKLLAQALPGGTNFYRLTLSTRT